MRAVPVASAVAAFVAIALLGVCRSAQAPKPAETATADPLDALLDAARKQHEIPALAAIATRADKVLEVALAGTRREGQPDLVTAESLFHIGSNAKAMTATVIAMLVEQGRLSWNSTPLDVFPEWKDQVRAEYRAVTLTDLLTHHAGLPAYDDDESTEFREVRSLAGTATEQRREFALRALRHEPAVVPRTKRFYSNGGYSIAAAMAERATGDAWESLMRTRLFEPLGIRATFEWPAFDDPSQTWGHFETLNGVVPHDPRDEYQLPAFLLPAGALSITPAEYAAFLRLHLRGLEGSDGLLVSGTIKHLHTPVDDQTALGWGVQEFEGAIASVHTGSAGTFFAIVAVWPSRDLGVAVFANAGGERAKAACIEVLKAVTRRYDSR